MKKIYIDVVDRVVKETGYSWEYVSRKFDEALERGIEPEDFFDKEDIIMEDVIIITRDENGKRTEHYLRWDGVCDYIDRHEFTDDDEILLVIAKGTCIFSGLWTVNQLTWTELQGFFA